jgi:hypothetical protein
MDWSDIVDVIKFVAMLAILPAAMLIEKWWRGRRGEKWDRDVRFPNSFGDPSERFHPDWRERLDELELKRQEEKK